MNGANIVVRTTRFAPARSVYPRPDALHPTPNRARLLIPPRPRIGFGSPEPFGSGFRFVLWALRPSRWQFNHDHNSPKPDRDNVLATGTFYVVAHKTFLLSVGSPLAGARNTCQGFSLYSETRWYSRPSVPCLSRVTASFLSANNSRNAHPISIFGSPRLNWKLCFCSASTRSRRPNGCWKIPHACQIAFMRFSTFCDLLLRAAIEPRLGECPLLENISERKSSPSGSLAIERISSVHSTHFLTFCCIRERSRLMFFTSKTEW